MARTAKDPHAMTILWRKKLGKWLRDRIKNAEHTQDSFGETVGLSLKTVNVIVNGSRDYGIDEALTAIACSDVEDNGAMKYTDPVWMLVSSLKGFNALDAHEIEACRIMLVAMNDSRMRPHAEIFLKQMAVFQQQETGEKTPRKIGKDGTGTGP